MVCRADACLIDFQRLHSFNGLQGLDSEAVHTSCADGQYCGLLKGKPLHTKVSRGRFLTCGKLGTRLGTWPWQFSCLSTYVRILLTAWQAMWCYPLRMFRSSTLSQLRHLASATMPAREGKKLVKTLAAPAAQDVFTSVVQGRSWAPESPLHLIALHSVAVAHLSGGKTRQRAAADG